MTSAPDVHWNKILENNRWISYPWVWGDFPLIKCIWRFGIMKRILKIWRKVEWSGKAAISVSLFLRASEQISTIQKRFGCKYPRVCRNYNSMDYCKASECTQFLLCIGPVALKDIVLEEQHTNFVQPSVSAYILCGKKWRTHYLDYSEQSCQLSSRRSTEMHNKSQAGFSLHSWAHIS